MTPVGSRPCNFRCSTACQCNAWTKPTTWSSMTNGLAWTKPTTWSSMTNVWCRICSTNFQDRWSQGRVSRSRWKTWANNCVSLWLEPFTTWPLGCGREPHPIGWFRRLPLSRSMAASFLFTPVCVRTPLLTYAARARVRAPSAPVHVVGELLAQPPQRVSLSALRRACACDSSSGCSRSGG
jgi:hypothetical protein